MTQTSFPANPVLSASPDAANSLTPERHVQSIGGELIKQEGRVLVRLTGTAKAGDVEVPFELVPVNGVLAKASKWRALTPENQLLMVTQRVNAKAIASLSKAVSEFVVPFIARASRAGLDAETFLTALANKGSTAPADIVFTQIEQRLTNAIEQGQEARDAALTRDSVNLADYPESFPLAHSMTRKFILIIGPTNSGKSHTAVQALANANTGVYLAPLRLLALENYERLSNHMGAHDKRVSLITGDERREVEGATHVASTVEMLDTRTAVDVAVIDEIQLLGDPERGSAWTAAVCGAPAPLVYLVGALEARAAVEALAKRLGCELEVHVLKRMSPLTVQAAAVGKIRNLKKGDAIVAFSRRDVLAWRDQVTEAGFSVATVYGNLSPEVRRAQAARFTEGKADIVVGTDAIAMGLNLPVIRIVLTTSNKFNGVDEEEISAALAQQIAGRAGRFGLHEEGFVAGFDDATHKVLRSLMQERIPPVRATGFQVAPTLEHLTRIAQATGEISLANLLKRFVRNIDVLDGFFKPRVTDEQVERALWLDTLPLSLEEKFTLSLVPVSTRIDSLNKAWQGWATGLSRKQPSLLRAVGPLSGRESLQDVEDSCKLYSAYAWLGYRCPDYFPSVEQALKLARAASELVDQMLLAQNMAQRQLSGKPGTPVPEQRASKPVGRSPDANKRRSASSNQSPSKGASPRRATGAGSLKGSGTDAMNRPTTGSGQTLAPPPPRAMATADAKAPSRNRGSNSTRRGHS
jgi:ATP-dependent RNA helicase SUPV3L1/SUV3